MALSCPHIPAMVWNFILPEMVKWKELLEYLPPKKLSLILIKLMLLLTSCSCFGVERNRFRRWKVSLCLCLHMRGGLPANMQVDVCSFCSVSCQVRERNAVKRWSNAELWTCVTPFFLKPLIKSRSGRWVWLLSNWICCDFITLTRPWNWTRGLHRISIKKTLSLWNSWMTFNVLLLSDCPVTQNQNQFCQVWLSTKIGIKDTENLLL